MSGMSCPRFDREHVEAYLLNRLGADEREAFERHLFECPDCAKDVEFLDDVRSALQRIPVEDVRVPRWHAPFLRRAALAAAAVAGVSLLTWVALRSPGGAPPRSAGSPVASSAELARIVPPRYEPTVLRGGGDPHERSFREAMVPYAKGDFEATIPRLEALVAADPRDKRARFYLGACYLLRGRTDDGIAALRAVAEAEDSPFQEEATFLLVKAFLSRGETDKARHELKVVIGLRGDFEADAKRLLASLPRK